MEEKQSQRRLALARRRSLSQQARRAAGAAICLQLEQLPALQKAGTILSYLATWDEADLADFHRWAAGQGKRLAFPVAGPDGQMEAYVPNTPQSLRQGRYGILSPDVDDSAPVLPGELDAVILPCVAFDEGGRRLGHGGGYYDRYLPRCPQARRVLVAFEVQRLERVAVEGHDVAAHMVVTEASAKLLCAAGT